MTTDGPSTLDPNAAGSVPQIHALGYDPAGVLLEYAWDLDGDGTFETAGQTASLQPQTLSGTSGHTVAVRVTSKSGLSATAQAVVQVPTATPTSGP